MNTPTIQDVNDLGCCCPLPECPGNRWQHQSRDIEHSEGYFKRWIRPPGADDADDLPEIFGTLTTVGPGLGSLGGQIEEGFASFYQGWSENPAGGVEDWAEVLQEATISASYAGDALINTTYNEALAYPIILITGSGSSSGVGQMSYIFGGGPRDPFDTAFADVDTLITAAHFTVTDDVYRHDDDLVQWTTTSGHPSLQGTGGSQDLSIYWCDVLVGTYDEITLTDSFTRTDLVEAVNLTLSALPFDPSIGTDLPEAITVVLWSKVGDFPWPPDDDIDAAIAIALDTPQPGGTAELDGKHYKVGIPEEWETMNAAWVAWTALHAAWEAEDPETRGDEPIRGGKRSVFECRWKEGYFPEKWNDYVDAHGIYLGDHADWTTEHAEWEETPEEERGDEPVEPTAPVKPTEPEDLPQEMTSREWIYGGPGEAPFSDYFVLTQPPDTGKCRPVNMMITCYHSEKMGVKPTAHGEQINFDNPQP